MSSDRRSLLITVFLLAFPSLLLAQQPLTNALDANLPPLPPAVTDAEVLPVIIDPKDPNVSYVGRFDLSGDPMAMWTASTVIIRFRGTALNAQLMDGGKNCWQVEVDGKPTTNLALGAGKHLYKLSNELTDGEHTVKLVKATEAYLGATEFDGFQLSGNGTLLPPLPASPYRLEVIGDSISCGNGNEGSPHIKQSTQEWENGYYSYGAIAARKFGADYICIGWSGDKMWPGPEGLIPKVYDYTLPNKTLTEWDFSKFIPQAVVINLSTNDFNKNPDIDQTSWIAAYEHFIARLRSHYPAADIYCASSPMLGGDKVNAPPTESRGLRVWSTQVAVKAEAFWKLWARSPLEAHSSPTRK